MQIFFAVYQINITTICTNTFILWKVRIRFSLSFSYSNIISLIVGGCSDFIRVRESRDEIIFMISWRPTPEGCYHRNCELKKPINYLEGKSRSGCQPGYWNNFPMNTNSSGVSSFKTSVLSHFPAPLCSMQACYGLCSVLLYSVALLRLRARVWILQLGWENKKKTKERPNFKF